MPYCTKCGTQVADGVAFCTACGAPMGAAPAAAQPVAPVVAAPSLPAPPRRRIGRAIGIALAVIVVLLVIALGVGYWLWSTPPTVDPGEVETISLAVNID